MIHVTSSLRRPAGALRKPSLPVRAKATPTPRDLVSSNLQAKLLELDDGDDHLQDVITEEIVLSLQNKSLAAGGCLAMFLSTSWKDRNRKPIVAEVFHKVTQETDEDFASLIESRCSNLLNVLTLLGKPDVNDLGMVTLLVNLFHMEDLPDEHRTAVEVYLVDIAKAFWPYFLPDKHEHVWNDDICDAICDVLHAVGKTLDEQCPVNMERAFINITMMLFTSCSISSYTLLRFLELKEFRAAKWSLPNSAKDYYKSAYLKHPRRISSNSPEKPDSPRLHCDVIDSPSEVNPTTYSSSSDSPRSCSDSDVSTTSSETKPSPTRADSPSSVDFDVFDSTENKTSVQCPINDYNPYIIKDANYEVTIKTNTSEDGTKNAVVRVKELQSTDSTAVNLESNNQISNAKFGHQDGLEDFDTCNSSVINLEEKMALSEVSPSSPTSIPGNERDHPAHGVQRDHPAHGLKESVNFEKFTKSVDFLQPQPDLSTSTDWHENSGTKTPFSGGFGVPGQPKVHRSSLPGNSTPPTGGFPRTSRALSDSVGNQLSNNDSERQFSNTGAFPRTNHTFRRAMSENAGMHSNNNDSERQFGNTGAFPSQRPTFQRTLSESDSNHVGYNEGQLQRQRSYERHYWRSLLEFPVQEASDEDSDQSSRLYLLSFAIQPASLQRPSDLTITPELDEEKSWLKAVVLREVTVQDSEKQELTLKMGDEVLAEVLMNDVLSLDEVVLAEQLLFQENVSLEYNENTLLVTHVN